MLELAVVTFAYLIGALPSGVWLARLAGVDVRRSGSGNIGATNVARTAGIKLGLLTLAADVLKGFVPVLVAVQVSSDPWLATAAGLAAVLGHVCSVFLRFGGGKGVATGLGVFLAVAPLATLPALVVFAIIAAATRYVSLASIAGAATLPLASLLLGRRWTEVLLGMLIAVTITVRHRDNLIRLWNGREPKFGMHR